MALNITKSALRYYSLYSYLKLILDFFLAIVLLLLLSPLVSLIVIILKISIRGNIFFIHERLGLNGKLFKLYKFRTMKYGRANILNDYLLIHPEKKIEWNTNHKLKNDPRITYFGKFLRDYSLDEIPQIFNILKGDMSFIGPRPIVEKEVSKYGENFNLYKECKPGLSGLWQVSGRNNTTYQERVDYDMYYIKNKSLLLDLKIFFKTIPVILFKKGAY